MPVREGILVRRDQAMRSFGRLANSPGAAGSRPSSQAGSRPGTAGSRPGTASSGGGARSLNMPLRLRQMYMASDHRDERLFARRTASSREHLRAGLFTPSSGSLLPSGNRMTHRSELGHNHPSFRSTSPMFAGIYLLPPSATSNASRNPHRRTPGRAPGSQGKLASDDFRSSAEAAAREDEMLFQIADTDGDWKLSYEEFRELIFSRVGMQTTEEKVLQWYRSLDRNGDGVVDSSEYFYFALRESLFRAEHEVSEAFVKDKTGADKEKHAFEMLTGMGSPGRGSGSTRDSGGGIGARKPARKNVSRVQFMKLSERLGFGEQIGQSVFDDVYGEFMKAKYNMLHAPTATVPPTATVESEFLLRTVQNRTNEIKPLLAEWLRTTIPADGGMPGGVQDAAMLQDARLDDETVQELKKLQGNVHGLLRKLRQVMRSNIQRTEALFRAWDSDGSMSLSKSEFGSALSGIGFSSDKELTQAIFDELDDDASFSITFAEFKSWLFSNDDEFESRLSD